MNVSLEKIVEIVEADESVTGPGFHERLFARIRSAPAGALEQVYTGGDGGEMETRRLLDAYHQSLAAAMDNIAMDMGYKIPCHRKGLLGGVIRWMKRLSIFVRLRTDVMAHQQASFNKAALAAIQLLTRRFETELDAAKAALDRERDERRAETETLKEEIRRLRKEA